MKQLTVSNIYALHWGNIPAEARTPELEKFFKGLTAYSDLNPRTISSGNGGIAPRKTLAERTREVEEFEKNFSTLAERQFSTSAREDGEPLSQSNRNLILRFSVILNKIFYRLYSTFQRPAFNTRSPISLEHNIICLCGKGPKENFCDNPNPIPYAVAKQHLLDMTEENRNFTPGAADVLSRIGEYENRADRIKKARGYLEIFANGSNEEQEVFDTKEKYWIERLCGEELNYLWKNEKYNQLFYEKDKLAVRVLHVFGNYLLKMDRLAVLTSHRETWEKMPFGIKIWKTFSPIAITTVLVAGLYKLFRV